MIKKAGRHLSPRTGNGRTFSTRASDYSSAVEAMSNFATGRRRRARYLKQRMRSSAIDRLSIRRRPRGLPLVRQWWGKLLFMHWPVPVKHVRNILPSQLSVDTYDGSAWLGVVPFTMWGVRPYFGPPLPGLNAFHELNVRTYVHYNGVPGVWFFSLDINSPIARWAGRRFYYLPYFNARINLRQQGRRITYACERDEAGAAPADFNAVWEIGDPLQRAEPDSLAFFLTERYCLYSANAEQLYRSRVHHATWPLRRAELDAHDSTLVESLGIPAPTAPPIIHYAESLRVDIWPLMRVRAHINQPMLEHANVSGSLS